jgi:hypothetical protein
MKSKILYLFLFISIGLLITSCKKDKNDTVVQSADTTAYAPGQIITKSLSVENDTVVKMMDVATNYGTTSNPSIFLVHQKTAILKTGYENVFFPVYKEELEAFMQSWAREFNLNINGTADEKANAYNHFLYYLVNNKIDAGLFVGAVTQKKKSLTSVVNMFNEAGKARFHTVVNIPSANDLLFSVVDENISPEVILNKYVKTNNLKDTDVGAIISVFKSVKEIAQVWIDFAKNNKATVNAPDNYMSFINASDTIVANYTGGTAFQSPSYNLSYDVGLWKAKINYHIVGTYGATNKNVPGAYIPSCNTLSTSLSCSGPAFSINASVGYSPAINVGTFDIPAAEMNGKVSVDYGDCCCFHYYSYLNFKINANTGYQEVSFSKGN